MRLYRVDKRKFENNSTITPSTNYEERLDRSRKEVEKKLNEHKPTKLPLRHECLYLFCSLSSALKFCSKSGGYIYEVTVEACDIYWRADMNILDNIYNVFQITTDEEVRDRVVSKYWEEGSHTFYPCYEILVREALVKGIVFDKGQDVAKTLCEDIELSPEYIAILEDLNNIE